LELHVAVVDIAVLGVDQNPLIRIKRSTWCWYRISTTSTYILSQRRDGPGQRVAWEFKPLADAWPFAALSSFEASSQASLAGRVDG
jgi:hypothetical protein